MADCTYQSAWMFPELSCYHAAVPPATRTLASTATGSFRVSSPALYVRYLITQITLLEKRMSERKLSNCNEHAHSHSHGQSLSLSLFDSSSTFNHITSCQTTRYPLDIDNVCSVVRYYSLTVKHKGAVDVI